MTVRGLLVVGLLVAMPYAAGAQTAPRPDADPRIEKIVASISEDRLRELLTKLVSFGTRNTLSDQASTTQGIGAARNWILDLKDRNVRINTISPGATRTPGLVDLAGPDAAQQQGLLDYLASQIPMGRVGEPEEIANAALFLASSDASFVNGIELFVDGGQNQI